MAEDYPYNTDYQPAPGEPAQLSFDNPYDDGLNPARGIINALLITGTVALTIFAGWAYFF